MKQSHYHRVQSAAVSQAVVAVNVKPVLPVADCQQVVIRLCRAESNPVTGVYDGNGSPLLSKKTSAPSLTIRTRKYGYLSTVLFAASLRISPSIRSFILIDSLKVCGSSGVVS